MTNKKLLSLALCLLMIFQLSLFTVIPANASKREINTQQDLEFLNALGIIDEQYDDISLGEKITRLDFAIAVARIFGNTPDNGEAEPQSRYNDMTSQGAEAVKAVNLLTDLGMISGSGDGNFNPYTNITYEQAVKILVCSLGYEIAALQNGGYPYGYFSLGASLGVTDGISLQASDYLNWESFITILSNSLFIDLMENTSFGDELDYSVVAGDTLLNAVMKVYHMENATVTSNSITTLGGGNGAGESYVEINKLIFSDPSSLAESYIGKKADVFYTETRSGKKEIIYIKADYEILKLDFENVYSLNGYRITYYDTKSQTEKNITVSADAVMIFNGQALYYTPSLVDLSKSGTIVLEKSASSSYSVVTVEMPETLLVSAVDYNKEIIYDKINSSSPLSLSAFTNANRCIIYKNGEKTDINGISEDMAVSVYKSPDGSLITLKAFNSKITGTISAFSTEYVTIDGNEYKYSSSVASDLSTHIGSICTIYTDEFGRIIYFTISAGDILKYGYLIAGSESSGINSKTQLRVLTQDDDITDFTVASKVKINGVSCSNGPEAVKTELALGNVWQKQLIQYSVNNDNEIKLINTAAGSGIMSDKYGTEGLKTFLSRGSHKYQSTKTTFSGRVSIDTGTKIFVVSPTGSDDTDDYQMRTPSYFTNDNSYTISAYNVNDGGRADVLVCWNELNDFSSVSLGGRVMMVDYVTTSVNADGEEVQKLYGLAGGKYASYITDGETSLTGGGRPLKRGDIVNLAYNSQNEICYVKLLVNIDNQKTTNYSYSTSNAWNGNWGISGAFYSMENNHALVSKTTVADLDSIFATPVYEDMYSVSLPSTVMVYDEELDSIYSGTSADIFTYKTAGANASRFFMRFYNDNLNTLFIFKYKN